MVAATGDDEDNLVTSLLSKQEFGVPRVLARVNHPSNEWLFTEQWGVDAAVSPPHILTAMVEEEVTVGDLVGLLPLERGGISIVGAHDPAGLPHGGTAIYELRLPPDCAIVAIIRGGHVVIPQPETVLADGDEVLALTVPDAEAVGGEVRRRSITGRGVVRRPPERRRGRRLGGELERRVHHAALRLMLGEQPVDDQAGPEVQALDRAAPHPHDADLTGAVVQERLERLRTLDRPDRDPADHPRRA